jgi:hypothetical protein
MAVKSNLFRRINLSGFYKHENKKLNGSNGNAPLRNDNNSFAISDGDKASTFK